MARGRKRLIAGWGLVGLGVAAMLLFIATRWMQAEIVLGRWSLWVGRGLLSVGWYGPEIGGSEKSLWLETPEWILFFRPNHGGWITDLYLGILVIDRSLDSAGRTGSWDIVITLWAWGIAALAIGWLLLVSGRKAVDRARKVLCTHCGYDLKGLAPGAGCPECGKSVRARRASEGESAEV